MNSQVQTLRGKIFTIRRTRENLARMESDLHQRLEKALVKANEVQREFVLLLREMQTPHPLLQVGFNYWEK